MRNSVVAGLLFAFVFGAVSLAAGEARAEKCPLVVIVLDRSGSMDTTVPGTSKSRWQVATEALTQLVQTKGDQLPFGLLTFTELNFASCTDFSAEAKISPATGTKQMILQQLMTLMPADGTNTGQAVDKAVEMINQQLTTDPSRTKGFIILVTDGAPACAPSGQSEPKFTVDRIAAAKAAGVDTFVVGMPGVVIDAMNMMSAAGGHPCSGCTSGGQAVSFYDASSPQALQQALDAITSSITMGEFGGGMCDDSCVTNGCDAGKICVNAACITDPCAGYRDTTNPKCAPGDYCWTDGTSGGCRPACSVACTADEFCSMDGTRCLPKNLCNQTCSVPGQICVDGKCKDDPCRFTVCPAGTMCATGYGTCSGTLSGGGGRGGRGKGGCEMNPTGAEGGALFGMLALLGLAFAFRARRTRAR